MNENLQKTCDKYMNYILEQLKVLLDIDSPTGYTGQVGEYLMTEYTRLGYTPRRTKKGGVLVDLGGSGNAVMVMAHVDTLGAMVAEVKDNGRLRLTPLGGLNANNVETENCTVRTLDGRSYEGTIQLMDASLHVNDKYQETGRSFDTIELLLDDAAQTKE